MLQNSILKEKLIFISKNIFYLWQQNVNDAPGYKFNDDWAVFSFTISTNLF